MANPPRRRWLQFSLRTLFFVVTGFAIWLGFEVKLVHDRQSMRRWIENNEWGIMPAFNPPDAIIVQDFSANSIPFWRRWMGDEPIALIALPEQHSKEHEASARRLFKEAFIVEEARLVPPMAND